MKRWGGSVSYYGCPRMDPADYSLCFTPTFKLVDSLLRAKRDYDLERELKRLDRFQVVILDDIGYIQQSREEMEVLFTFLAECYERRSVVITSNQVYPALSVVPKDYCRNQNLLLS